MTASEPSPSRPPDLLVRGLRWAGMALLVGTKLATLAFVAESVARPHQPRYRGKAMRIRALGYAVGLGLVPMAWIARGRQTPYPVAADLAVSVPMLIDAAGNWLGIYDAARVDDLVHGVNSAALSGLFGAVVSAHVPSAPVAAGATIVFGVVGELLFDGMEYVGERLGFDGLGLSPEDTLADVAAATIGACVAAVVTWWRWSPRGPHPHGGPVP